MGLRGNGNFKERHYPATIAKLREVDAFTNAKANARRALEAWFDCLDDHRPGLPPVDRKSAYVSVEFDRALALVGNDETPTVISSIL